MGRGFDNLYLNSKRNGKGLSISVYASYLNSIFLVSFSSFGSCGTLRILPQATYQLQEFLKRSKSKQTIIFAMGRGFEKFVPLY